MKTLNEKFSQISAKDPPDPDSEKSRRRLYRTAGVTSGSSVLGIRYDSGVMIAADTLVSYGSEKSFPETPRVCKLNECLLFGASGDYPDFQHIRAKVECKIIEDFCFQEPDLLKPSMMTRWLAKTLYERREAKDPLSFDSVIGGLQHDGTPYLGYVDRQGSAFTDFLAVTGMACMGIPMIWSRRPPNREFTAQEAGQLIEDIMAAAFYRDTTAHSQYLVGICSPGKCSVEGPFKVKEEWSVATLTSGY